MFERFRIVGGKVVSFIVSVNFDVFFFCEVVGNFSFTIRWIRVLLGISSCFFIFGFF